MDKTTIAPPKFTFKFMDLREEDCLVLGDPAQLGNIGAGPFNHKNFFLHGFAGLAIDSEGMIAAFISGTRIDTGTMRRMGNLHAMLEPASNDLRNLAFDLLDQKGHLKEEFILGEDLEKNMNWDENLERAAIFFIGYLKVEQNSRLVGLGRYIFLEFMNFVQKRAPYGYAFVGIRTSVYKMITYSMWTTDQSDLGCREEVAKCFLKGLNFKRVGMTDFYYQASTRPKDGGELNNSLQQQPGITRENYGLLHAAIRDLKDHQVAELIQFGNINDADFAQKNQILRTPLHELVNKKYHETIFWIYTLDSVKMYDFSLFEIDANGETPLDIVERMIEEKINDDRVIYGYGNYYECPRRWRETRTWLRMLMVLPLDIPREWRKG